MRRTEGMAMSRSSSAAPACQIKIAQIKKAGRFAPGPFWLSCSLEAGPHAELHFARSIRLRVLYAPACCVGEVHRRVAENVVVEDVGKDHRELECDALVDLDAFFHAHVDVPVGRSVDRTNSGILGVDAEHGRANLVVYRDRILEHVNGTAARTGGSGSHLLPESVFAACDVIVRGVAAVVLAGEDALLVCEVVV